MIKIIANYVLALVIGSLGGAVVGIGINCAQAWRSGNSADPRCVFAWKGYVTVMHLGETATGDRISCVYRPDITGKR